jgi:flagellar biosynthesis protein FlhB
MSESEGEKSFAPSARRKRQAAEKGDVLRSRDLATAAGVLVGALALRFAGPFMLDGMADVLTAGFVWDRSALENFDPVPGMLGRSAGLLWPVLALGMAVIAASVVSQLGFGEGRWLASNLMPKASRLDPMAGLKRMFGPAGWIESSKGMLKIALLGAIVWFWARGRIAGLLALGDGAQLGAQLALAWEAMTSLLLALAAGLVVIALIDLPVQWLRRNLRLRMTMQDMRDEQKETEGAPEKKAAIRQRQRQIAMGSIAGAMRQAQFVITNPTHFAVAMAYDASLAPAPVVLAKGRGEKALAMRELAAEHGVPVLEYPALARSVYYTTRERQMIREELFGAVASVLAFVLSLKRGDAVPRPQVDVPVLLRFDAEGRLEGSEAP